MNHKATTSMSTALKRVPVFSSFTSQTWVGTKLNCLVQRYRGRHMSSTLSDGIIYLTCLWTKPHTLTRNSITKGKKKNPETTNPGHNFFDIHYKPHVKCYTCSHPKYSCTIYSKMTRMSRQSDWSKAMVKPLYTCWLF